MRVTFERDQKRLPVYSRRRFQACNRNQVKKGKKLQRGEKEQKGKKTITSFLLYLGNGRISKGAIMANCLPPCLLQDLLSHTQISSVLICILQHCVPGKQCNSWPCSRNTKSLMSYGTLLPFPSFWIYFLPSLLPSTAFLDCSCLSSKPWSAPSPDPAAASIHSARDSQVCPTGHRRKYTISTWALCSRKLRCQIWKKNIGYFSSS